MFGRKPTSWINTNLDLMNAQHGKLSDPWSYYNYENSVIKVDLMVLQNEKTGFKGI